MKKPKYMISMYGFVLLSLGVMFIIFGILVSLGVMQPSNHSMIQDRNDMTLFFCMFGMMLCVSNVFLIFIANKKEKEYLELISNGRVIVGKVEKVRYKKETHIGKSSPYIIYFSYMINDEKKNGKSHLLWEKPNFVIGQDIDIYINDTGKIALKI